MGEFAFKCPVCGGDVIVNADIYSGGKNMSVDFKCRKCGDFCDIDATDVLEDARDYFESRVKRIEGGR